MTAAHSPCTEDTSEGLSGSPSTSDWSTPVITTWSSAAIRASSHTCVSTVSSVVPVGSTDWISDVGVMLPTTGVSAEGIAPGKGNVGARQISSSSSASWSASCGSTGSSIPGSGASSLQVKDSEVVGRAAADGRLRITTGNTTKPIYQKNIHMQTFGQDPSQSTCITQASNSCMVCVTRMCNSRLSLDTRSVVKRHHAHRCTRDQQAFS